MNRNFLVLFVLLFAVPSGQSGFAQRVSPLHFGHWVQSNSQRTVSVLPETWTTKRNYNWDSGASDWELNNVTAATRNAQDQLVTEVILNPGPTSLDSSLRYLYTYAVVGEPWTERLDQTWNGAGWDDNMRQIHAYDSQGNKTIDLELIWTGGAWDTLTGTRFNFTYNTSNLITEVIEENWDSQSNLFEPVLRERYTYSLLNEPDSVWTDVFNLGSFVPSGRLLDITWNDFSAGEPAGYFRQTFNNGFWANIDRFNWTYGANGSYEQINLEWINSAWTIVGKYDVVYDAQERLTSFERFDFANNAYVFSTGSQYEIMYASDLQPTEIIRLTAASDSIYTNIEKDEFTAIVGRPSPFQQYAGLSIFPNPFQDQLNIQIVDLPSENLHLKIYDQMGRLAFRSKWRTGSGNDTHSLELPELSPGLYLYILQGETGVNSGSLIKK